MKKKRGQRKPRQPRQKSTAPLGVYCNHVVVAFGPAELTVNFGQTRPEMTTDGLAWPVTEITRLTLPVEAAKVLCFELARNVAEFETLFGAVNLAPPLVPAMPPAGGFSPDSFARIVVLHAELFTPVPPTAPTRPTVGAGNSDLGKKITTH